jgi:K+-sensing histidine kinase KdpD
MVIDEGPGIPIDFRDRVFDQFEIITMKRGVLPQIGLGLAFCKMVVEAHGGCISVEDNEPTGAIFRLEI